MHVASAHCDPSRDTEPPRLRILDAEALPLRVEPLALLSCSEGDLAVRAGGKALRVHRGELLVLRRGAAFELGRAGARQRAVLFEASPAWVDAFWALHGDLAAQSEPPERELLPAAAGAARRAAQLLGRASAEEPRPLGPAGVAALLELAFQAHGSPLGLGHSREQRSGGRRELIRGLADYDPEADGAFSLQELAEQLGLSSRQTARLVRGETGRSFRELKAAARIERARKLLVSSDLSILEVALRAGWNSSSQFHEAFRQSVGVTPARYRAAHRR